MNTGRPSLTVKRACTCSTWGMLDAVARDTVLVYFMDWAWVFHQVELKLLSRGERIAICELH